MLTFIPREHVEDFKTNSYIKIISKNQKEDVNEVADFLRLESFRNYEEIDKITKSAYPPAENIMTSDIRLNGNRSGSHVLEAACQWLF